MTSLLVRTLGPLEFIREEIRVIPRGQKGQALLAFLAVSKGGYSRHRLTELFFSKANDPMRSLRWHLHDIRTQFGKDIIVEADGELHFDHQVGEVDCVGFEQILDTTLEQQQQKSIENAVQLYRGDFLANLKVREPAFEIWLLGEQARFRRLYERGLQELINRYNTQAQFVEALPWAVQLTHSDPCAEDAHKQLIELYSRIGQREAAIRQFQYCQDVLSRELGVEPSAELRAVFATVSSQPAMISMPEQLAMVEEVEELHRSANFVGREKEIDVLSECWVAAQKSNGVVLLGAEAGGGKTRLIHEFSQTVTNVDLLVGPCYESTQKLAYRPWIELMELIIERLEESALAQLPVLSIEHLKRLLPSAALLRQQPSGVEPLSAVETQFMFNAIADLMIRLPYTAHKLIFVDNLQWADEVSLQLFHYMANLLTRQNQSVQAEERVLLIGAYRSEEVSENLALQKLIHDLNPTVATHIQLSSLGHADIAELIQDIHANSSTEDCALWSTIVLQATGGNPFFVTELLRELDLSHADLYEGHLTSNRRTLPVPNTVRELLLRRLGQSSSDERQVLETIAVLGEPSTLQHIEQVSARTEETTVAALDTSMQYAIIQVHPQYTPVRYEFAHDLIGEVVRQGISDVRRRLLHRRAATALADEVSAALPQRQMEVAGRITSHAIEGEAFSLLYLWAPLAAQYARRISAYTDALSACNATLIALAHQKDEDAISEKLAQRHYIALQLERLELLYPLGRRDEGETLIIELTDLLHQYSDSQFEAKLQLTKAFYLGAAAAYKEAIIATQKARALFQGLGDEHGEAQALFRAGELHMFRSQNTAGYALLEKAVELYRTVGESGGESVCLSSLAWCSLQLGKTESAFVHLDKALAAAEKQGDLYAKAHTHIILAGNWSFYYQTTQMRAAAQSALQICRDKDIDSLVGPSLLTLGASYYMNGDSQKAKPILEEALTAAEAAQDLWAEGWITQTLGRIALRSKDLTGAAQWLHYAHDVRMKSMELQGGINDLAWLSRLANAQGEHKGALDYSTQAVNRIAELQEEVYIWETHDVYLIHARNLAFTGQTKEAQNHLQYAYDHLTRFANRIQDTNYRAHYLAYPFSKQVLDVYNKPQLLLAINGMDPNAFANAQTVWLK